MVLLSADASYGIGLAIIGRGVDEPDSPTPLQEEVTIDQMLPMWHGPTELGYISFARYIYIIAHARLGFKQSRLQIRRAGVIYFSLNRFKLPTPAFKTQNPNMHEQPPLLLGGTA